MIYLKWAIRILAVIGVFIAFSNMGVFWAWSMDFDKLPPDHIVQTIGIGLLLTIPNLLYKAFTLESKRGEDDEKN